MAEALLAGDISAVGTVVDLINPAGAGAFVIVCEHASCFIPPELNNLGLRGDVLQSHIAWDSGAFQVALAMSAALDAPLIAPRVSRLVYDCNRALKSKASVPEVSELHAIPGNTGLDEAKTANRAAQYYMPFHTTLGQCIESRMNGKQPPVLMTIHSFTQVYNGVRRNLDIGIVNDIDARFSSAILTAGYERGHLKFARNKPYGPEDGVTHTLREHAIKRGLLNAMIEIRDDLIADAESQLSMALMLADIANEALGINLDKNGCAQ